MITRIELVNFMSHKATVIEPAAGLTVLVGPNNCGKSAVVAALRILCHNENSTYVLRHGERECSVTVVTDDGHTIVWRRKNSPAYTIDGEPFDRLKSGGLPEPLHKALRLPKVEAGDDDEFDVHFGEQKAPIFLLGDSPAKAARFFASSSDAIRLVEMQKRHKEKLALRQREKVRLEAEAQRLAAELAALEPALAIQSQVEAVEAKHAELGKQALRAEELAHEAAEIASRALAAERCRAEAAALAVVSPPPPMQDEPELVRAISHIAESAAHAAQARGELDSLDSLTAPPKLADTAALMKLLSDLDGRQHDVARDSAAAQSLHDVSPPPQLPSETELSRTLEKLTMAGRQREQSEQAVGLFAEIHSPSAPQNAAPLAEWLARVQAASEQVAECRTQLSAADAELAATLDELESAVATSVCPTCGGPLDMDRVLQRATVGLAGGHAHA